MREPSKPERPSFSLRLQFRFPTLQNEPGSSLHTPASLSPSSRRISLGRARHRNTKWPLSPSELLARPETKRGRRTRHDRRTGGTEQRLPVSGGSRIVPTDVCGAQTPLQSHEQLVNRKTPRASPATSEKSFHLFYTSNLLKIQRQKNATAFSQTGLL